ncbi:MAG: DUF4097 domain-containing protein [Oscillospiraceae bacterium]|nr:DUF4097 domain-containing protein [Oscillospiraceae bacterium]
MKRRRFRVKRKRDIKVKLLIALSLLCALSSAAAVLAERYASDRFGGYVSRDTRYVELAKDMSHIINIHTAGIPLSIETWDGDTVKVSYVSELPVIISEKDEDGYTRETTISQDDGFAVSFFTLELFSYHMKVYLPQDVKYKQINIKSVSGDVVLNAYHLRVAEGVNVTTDSASIEVTRPATPYSVRTNSGNVSLDFDYLVSIMVVNSTQGNITARVPDSMMYNVDLLYLHSRYGDVVVEEKDTSVEENFPWL